METVHLFNILALFWMHFLADFVFQSREMATKKSTDNSWLTYHVTLYSICFLYWGLLFALVNFALHWVTDYISSRWSKHFWINKNEHAFWCVIGADQAVHITSLIGTYYLFHVAI